MAAFSPARGPRLAARRGWLVTSLAALRPMSLEPRTLERIAREFPASDQTSVIELLNGYAGREAGRVAWDILELSKGSVESVRRYLQAAQADYRDVLYWAEYYDHDPLLRGRDPKQMVEDLLAKWGDKQRAK
jgi:hypothetical protein